MSRKHAPPPDTDTLTIAKAIARSLHAARERGETPVAIIMGPDIAPVFRREGIGGWSHGRPELFSLPVEIDPEAEGGTIRVR